MSLLSMAGWGATGFALTPLLEYAWHAWVAHGRRPHESRESHLLHHRTVAEVIDPWVEMRQNVPLVGKTLLAIGLCTAPFLGLTRTLPFAAGLLGGYVFITWSHARMHRRPPQGRFEEWMWRFHFHHHYQNPRVNFGLTSPLLDFLFGTVEQPDEVEVPEGAAPAWLTSDRPGFRMRPAASEPR
jgi:sterol desaturase/sphingolipid hydroxylase (fatty acid hydroxylase superfamily)